MFGIKVIFYGMQSSDVLTIKNKYLLIFAVNVFEGTGQFESKVLTFRELLFTLPQRAVL